MKTEQEVKAKLAEYSNMGSKSKKEEDILFAKINILHWVLQPTADALINALNEKKS